MILVGPNLTGMLGDLKKSAKTECPVIFWDQLQQLALWSSNMGKHLHSALVLKNSMWSTTSRNAMQRTIMKGVSCNLLSSCWKLHYPPSCNRNVWSNIIRCNRRNAVLPETLFEKKKIKDIQECYDIQQQWEECYKCFLKKLKSDYHHHFFYYYYYNYYCCCYHHRSAVAVAASLTTIIVSITITMTKIIAMIVIIIKLSSLLSLKLWSALV